MQTPRGGHNVVVFASFPSINSSGLSTTYLLLTPMEYKNTQSEGKNISFLEFVLELFWENVW